ncbi:DUF948 domain-containing protein [Peribacillus kribbensis]|uniref:DUF948 domain-containing protein n=1 Tax=Peribacillus kribbensis TaxID=356658 RepID=UPI00041D5589|nr:DUF948 domain-containing protein [Peribacillus kribbensis]
MRIILYLSIAVIAIAFVLLVLYLGRTLKALEKTMLTVSDTISRLEGQLQGVTAETAQLLHKTNALAENIQEKSENLDSVFVNVKHMGDSLQGFNSSLKKVSVRAQTGIEGNQSRIANIIKWTNFAKEMYDRYKDRKTSKRAVNTAGMQ